MAIIGKNLEVGSGVSAIPSAYKLDSINITNYKGDTVDIKNLAVRMEITESLYVQSLKLKLTLKDSTNFIEEFPVTGQERVEVQIRSTVKRGKSGKKTEKFIKKLKLNFFITEYPTFGSVPGKYHTDVISLIGISEQSYISNQKKISRSYVNNTAKEIEKILKEDLNLPAKKFKTSDDAISSSRGIIPNQRPMDVIEWFRKQTYSENNYSPFFFFQTLNGKYKLFSLASLIDDDNPVFDTYHNTKNFNTEANTPEDYRQRETRILSISSDLKLNKSIQARAGAYASRNNYLDYSNKTYTNYEYNYVKDFSDKPSLESESVLSNKFKVADDNFIDFTQAHCEYISVNSNSFEGNNNYNEMSKVSRHFLNAYNALHDTFTHDIRLNGNFKLNAGRKIELVFPKTIDPNAYRDVVKDPDDINKNRFLSGKYLITSAIHEFENDEYHVNIRVKRDSFSIKLLNEDSP